MRKYKQRLSKHIDFSKISQLALFSIFSCLIFILYYQRIGSHSFGDEWNNFMAGFFMQKGRLLYSQIFYNHQMLAAYVSYIIQSVFHPQSLYTLLLYHRVFILVFSLILDILLIFRFGWKGFAFAIIYELTKYYFFGFLFLAESMTVQPLVYMLAVWWEKVMLKKISGFDYILAGIFTWFVLFLREPLSIVAFALYIGILWGRVDFQAKKKSVLVFLFLSILIGISVGKNITAYIEQVLMFNLTVILPFESRSSGDLASVKGFFYPVSILFTGQINYLRYVLVGLDVVFLTTSIFFLVRSPKKYLYVFLFSILGLASLRFVTPGKMFFESFHLVPWYGLFIMSTLLLAETVRRIYPRMRLVIVGAFCVILVLILSANSFVWEKVDRNRDFSINYAHYYLNGEVFRVLSKSTDTLFADKWDYLINWQANLDTPYTYGIYSFATASCKTCAEARIAMFQKNPPDFYYTYCPTNIYSTDLLPQNVRDDYFPLYTKGNPTCLFIHKKKIPSITTEQKNKIEELGFYLM